MTLNCSFVTTNFVAKYFRFVALWLGAWQAKTLKEFLEVLLKLDNAKRCWPYCQGVNLSARKRRISFPNRLLRTCSLEA